jgi:hypothetical protein
MRQGEDPGAIREKGRFRVLKLFSAAHTKQGWGETPSSRGSFAEIARHLAEQFPGADEFPDPPPRPENHERPSRKLS